MPSRAPVWPSFIVSTSLVGYWVRSKPAFWMSGVMSRNWPAKPARPLMPTGPIRSGALPEAISVLRIVVAVAFWTISRDSRIGILPSVRLSCRALKSLTTVCCNAIWAGFVPEPRPTNQRTTWWSLPLTLMIWPGLAVEATADGEAASVDAGVDATGAVDGGAVAGVEPPHAPAAMATTETRAANRVRLLVRMWLLLSLCERNPVPWNPRARRTIGRVPVAQSFPVGGPPLDCL